MFNPIGGIVKVWRIDCTLPDPRLKLAVTGIEKPV